MPKYTVKKISGAEISAHRDAVANLWRSVLSNAAWDGRFEWLYEDNPAGHTTTWLAVVTESGEVAGCNSLYARRLYVHGKPVLMGIAADFAVHAAHRVFGPALQLQREIVAQSPGQGYSLNFAYPNKSGDAVFFRAGYQELGESNGFVKLLRTKSKIARRVHNATIAAIIGQIADAALRIGDRILTLSCCRSLCPEILHTCDQRFDVLWERTRAEYPVIGEKTSAFLNWRYTSCGTEKFRYFCLLDSSKTVLEGFIVFAIRDGVATIYDVFAVRNIALFKYLFLQFALSMRKYDVTSIIVNYLGDGSFRKLLRSVGFINRAHRRKCLLFSDSVLTGQGVFDQQGWFIFDGEMDL